MVGALEPIKSLFETWRQEIGKVGAGEGDRTLVLSLENSCSTIELHPQLYSKHTDISIRTASEKAMVGEVGLEPTKP